MLDISWTEFLLIGVVALIVIGPKELPAVMRTMGQWTRKVRSMAADFQNQFQEAMREAEMADLKKQVDDMANFDPLKDVKSGFDTMGKDFQASLEQTPPAAANSTPAVATGLAATVAPEAETKAASPAEPSEAAPPVAASPADQVVAEGTVDAALVPPEAGEGAAQGDSTGRTG